MTGRLAQMLSQSRRQSSRLRGPSVYQGGGGPKFEIKHESRCLQNSKFVNWEAKHVDWGGGGQVPWLPLGAGPVLSTSRLMRGGQIRHNVAKSLLPLRRSFGSALPRQ